MASMLKRKRSDSELSFCSSTTLASPSKNAASFDLSASAALGADTFASAMYRGFRAPAHLNSRTIKRTRNGRPSDAEVHEHTLSLLYAAQEFAYCQPSPVQDRTSQYGDSDGRDSDTSLAPMAPQSTEDSPPTNQPSLYSFWSVACPAPHKPQPQPPAI